MGKAQYKKRIRSARHHANGVHVTPEGVPNPTPQEALQVSSKPKNKKNKDQQKQREATVAIVDKIASPSSHDRIWSLAAVSNLVLSSQSIRQLLLSKNLVRLLIDRLKEDEDQYDVLVQVTGVLRNLAIEGGKDVCGEMANKGILHPLNLLVSRLMTSITDLVTQIGNGNGPGGGESVTAQSLLWTQVSLMSENVVIVLWSLAETSNKWLDSVATLQDIVPFLSTILKLYSDQLDANPAPRSAAARYTIPSSCALASGQCLYTLTEDHPSLVKRLTYPNEESIRPLISFFGTFEKKVEKFSDEDNENLELLKVVSVGILRNIIIHARKRADGLSFKPAYEERMPQILTAKLHVNLAQLAAEAAEANQAIPTPPLTDINIAKASFQEPSQAQVKLESIERRLTIVQLSLELVGEWCASADGFECDDECPASVSNGDETSETDMGDADHSGQDVEGPPSENGDVDMEERPSAEARNSSTHKSNGVEPDHKSTEQDSDAMEIEDSSSFLPVSHAALFSNLLDKLGNLAQPTPYLYQSPESEAIPKDSIPAATHTNGSTCPMPSGSIPDLVNELLSSIHLRAADALNNMMITVDRLEADSQQFATQFVSINQQALCLLWNSCWSTIADLSRHAHLSRKGKQKIPEGSVLSHQYHREQLLVSTLTCFWSLSRVILKHQASCGVLQVTAEHSQCLAELLRSTENETLKARALSTLICFACRPDVSVDENAVIGDLLMNIVSNSQVSNSDVYHSLFIGALDGVFDVYADETRTYDEPVFQRRRFLESLEAAVPKMQGIVKKIDKRKDPNLRQQAEEVQSNLMAFIKYRKSLM